jgi:V/A-type H+/Na+-transporting ATPase subunit E
MMKQAAEENMDALSRAILSEAQAEADQILADAQKRADEIRQRAEQQAAEVRKEALNRANQEAERLRGQKVATSQLKARTMQLEHREKLLNKVFQEAEKELPNIRQWTDYEEIAHNLLTEALTQMKAQKVVVRADPYTQKLIKQDVLESITKERGVQIEIGEPLQKGIGVIVEADGGRLQYDNTLETRLRRMLSSMRASVYHTLMGEKV